MHTTTEIKPGAKSKCSVKYHTNGWFCQI